MPKTIKTFAGKVKDFAKRMYHKRVLLIIGLLLTLVVFHTLIEDLLNKVFVDNLWSTAQSDWSNDIAFGIIFLLTLGFFFIGWRRYLPSIGSVYLSLFVAAYYGIYRFEGSVWMFSSFGFCDWLKYADVIFILPVLLVTLRIVWKKGGIISGENAFVEDKPIADIEADLLGYKKYAKILAVKIKDTHPERAIAIGINGRWGSGKTTFMNLLKKMLNTAPSQKEANEKSRESEPDSSTYAADVITIDFSPWGSDSPAKIVSDFFETVQKATEPFDASLSKLIRKYADKLQSAFGVSSGIVKSVTGVLDELGPAKDIFDLVNKALKTSGTRMIIYIDDLDRLDKKEVMEVIRLIRNTASFFNTIFVVAYDRNYVVSAIKEFNAYGSEWFLEKIFQIEISLPQFQKDLILAKLKWLLISRVRANMLREFEQLSVIFSAPQISDFVFDEFYIEDWIENLRDVYRLVNSIALNYQPLQGEVVFVEFFLLELLRFKFPAIYELLFIRRREVVRTINSQNGLSRYVLGKENNPKWKGQEGDENSLSPIEGMKSYLISHSEELSISPASIGKIIEILGLIFQNESFGRFKERHHLSIVFPSKFDRYFSYSLLDGDLSEIEFSKARDLDFDKFWSKVEEWTRSGLANEVKNRLAIIEDFDNVNDYEKIIKIIFLFSNLQIQGKLLNAKFIVPVEFARLFNKIRGKKNNIITLHYGGDFIPFKAFILSLFENAKSPFLFESGFLRELEVQRIEDDDFVLTRDERKQFLIKYLTEYCAEHEPEIGISWQLFNYTILTDEKDLGGNRVQIIDKYPIEAVSVFRNCVESKAMDDFLLFVREEKLTNAGYYAVSEIAFEIFGDWQTFKEVLIGQKNRGLKNLDKFLQFFEKFEEVNYSEYVPFDFS